MQATRYLMRPALALALGCMGAAQAAPWYHLTPIGPASTIARGMNAKGYVVGTAGSTAVTYIGGAYAAYALPDAYSTSFIGINDHGMVAGSAGMSTRWGAFRFDHGTFTMLNTPPDDFDSVAFAVNNAGVVAGVYTTNGHHPFTSVGTNVTTLWPGEAGGMALDINNAGTVAGMVFRHGEQIAVIDANGAMTDIGSFGGTAAANAVSENGLVVGSFSAGAYRVRGFYYDGNSTTVIEDPLRHVSLRDVNSSGMAVGNQSDLDDDLGRSSQAFLYTDGERIALSTRLHGYPGWEITEAVAINDNGQIAANACLPLAGICQAVRLDVSPIPEPAGWTMLLAGLGTAALLARRRRDGVA
jgi:uncharacterized membrane protein